jgi:predicted DNA-binding transcriptional regulator AlpA
MHMGGGTTDAHPTAFDRILSEKQLLDWLGIASATASRWRLSGEGPPYVQLGPRRIGYRRSAIEQWLAGREQTCQRKP